MYSALIFEFPVAKGSIRYSLLAENGAFDGEKLQEVMLNVPTSKNPIAILPVLADDFSKCNVKSELKFSCGVFTNFFLKTIVRFYTSRYNKLGRERYIEIFGVS